MSNAYVLLNKSNIMCISFNCLKCVEILQQIKQTQNIEFEKYRCSDGYIIHSKDKKNVFKIKILYNIPTDCNKLYTIYQLSKSRKNLISMFRSYDTALNYLKDSLYESMIFTGKSNNKISFVGVPRHLNNSKSNNRLYVIQTYNLL